MQIGTKFFVRLFDKEKKKWKEAIRIYMVIKSIDDYDLYNIPNIRETKLIE